MKRIQVILSLLSSLAGGLVNGQTGTIVGHIHDRRENKGLAFANAWLIDTKLGAMTDTSGNFRIDHIPLGTYALTVNSVGYGDTTVTIIITNSAPNYNVKVTLPPYCEYDKSEGNKTCPICGKKDQVLTIVYGFQIGPLDTAKYYDAGCGITNCDPNWYCKRDQLKF